jgi:hypothetical protein
MLRAKEIVDAALQLDPKEREEVINELWASLDGSLGEGMKRPKIGEEC